MLLCLMQTTLLVNGRMGGGGGGGAVVSGVNGLISVFSGGICRSYLMCKVVNCNNAICTGKHSLP